MVLHIDNFPAHEGIPVLNSLEEKEIQNFLEVNISDTDAENLRVIEWRPSLNHYREKYVKLLSQVVDFIKRMEAGKRTTAAFGKRWVRNFFRNIGNINKGILYRQSDLQVIITGSGPGLQDAFPLIKEAQNTSLVIASSSSVMALAANGISADLIVTTDGGAWALKHMYSFCNDYKDSALIAASLFAALPSQALSSPFLLINDGSFWQNVIFHELSLPSVLISQKGTVTATALELALLLSIGNIYLAGMDFSFSDIRTHVKPYAFDSIFFNNANRFTPVYSEYFTRSSLINRGGSMDIYASWFKTQILSWPKRIFSMTQSGIFNEGKPDTKRKQKKANDYFETVSLNKDFSPFRKRASDILLNALKNSEYSHNIKKELCTLLLNGEENVSEEKLESIILEIANE